METDVQKRIRERAYAIWLEEGRPHGRDTDHWLLAERDIAASLTGTAPVALATAEPATAEPVRAEPVAKPKRTRSTAAKAPEEVKAPAAKPVVKRTEAAEPKTPRTRRKTSTAPA